MAALTYFIDADRTITGVHGATGLTLSDPGAEASTVSGWTVAKVAPTVYCDLFAGTKVASTSFAAPALPATPWSGNGLITDAALTGTFSAGIWTATMKVIAVVSGGDQDGNLRFRLWKTTLFDGSGVTTELTSVAIDGGTVTNLTTAAAVASSGSTASIGPFTLSNEYLMLAVAWKISGAGGANTRDVVMRKATGITLVTPNFTPSAALPFQASEGEEHSDPRSLQLMDRVSVSRGSLF